MHTIRPERSSDVPGIRHVNLSAFESFFSERRPFFVDGKGVFDFRVNCVVVVDCSTGEGLFYSRRIGRSPQLAGLYGNDNSATSTNFFAISGRAIDVPNK